MQYEVRWDVNNGASDQIGADTAIHPVREPISVHGSGRDAHAGTPGALLTRLRENAHASPSV